MAALAGTGRQWQGGAMTAVTIRPATPADAAPLAALKLAAFRQTFLDEFAIPYPPADLATFEQASYGEAQVAAELADPTHRSWVAEVSGALVAYAHAGPCKLPHPDASRDQGELYQLYALTEAKGVGVGRRLIAQALDWLAEAMPGPVWLGVWSGNVRAQAFYARHGFEKVGEYGFPVGDWTDREHIYRKPAP